MIGGLGRLGLTQLIVRQKSFGQSQMLRAKLEIYRCDYLWYLISNTFQKYISLEKFSGKTIFMRIIYWVSKKRIKFVKVKII